LKATIFCEKTARNIKEEYAKMILMNKGLKIYWVQKQINRRSFI